MPPHPVGHARALRRGLLRPWAWCVAASLATLVATSAQAAPFLVKDIADANQGSDPFGLIDASGRLFFTAFHKIPPGAGAQTWRSDAGGTVFLADGEVMGKVNDAVLIARCEPLAGCALVRGDAAGALPLATILPGSFDARLSEPTVVGDIAFFTAQDNDGGALWKTDGTVAGTRAIFEFGTQPAFELTASGGLLYFARCEDTGCALWTSDGTSAAPVVTVVPGPWSEDDERSMFGLTDVAGTLYFATCARFGECELWRTDGTEGGTVDIAHFDPNNDPDSDDWEEPVLIALGSRLLFYAVDDEGDKGLWSTDGTSPGTLPLADVDDRDPQAAVGGGDRMFFRGADENGDRELWVTDGTSDGTYRVADLNPGPVSSDPSRLCPDVAGVVFMACDDATGCEPWASDGTEPGTVRLADINTGPASSGFGDCRRGSGERVYFSAVTAGAGREMWRTDGTPAGTAQVANINPGPAGSNPREFVAIDLTNPDDRVFFTACQEKTGCEVWQTDGTPGGTSLFEDLEDTGVGSDPAKLRLANGFVFFLASDPSAGRELWRTDGSGTGTIRLTDVRPGFESSVITDLTAIDGGTLFTAGNAPWKSDGTVAGTAPLAASGSANCTPGEYTAVSGTVFFKAGSTDDGCELWRTDGTAAGTSRAVDIVSGPGGSAPNQLVGVGQTLFFVATDAEHGAELWKSDGTAEGTMLVKNIAPEGPGPNDPPLSAGLGDLTASGNLLFFTAFNYGCSCSDTELWRSDGTEAGTFQVKDIYPGPSASEPALLTDVDGTLFFRACEPLTGCELWRSDGTEQGTGLVAETNPGTGGTINNLVAVDGSVFFSARDDLGADTLWTSDGTPAGTRMVTTLPRSGDGSSPRGFTKAGGKLLYVVSDQDSGSELWTSDGTEGGTRRLTDIWPGPGSSISELSMATLNGSVFFQATEPEHGPELWGLSLCDGDPACVGTTTTTTTIPIGSTTTTTATVPIGSTTTTTPPPGLCTSDAECARAEECADVRCVAGTCTTSSAPTFDRAACELRALAASPTCAAEQSSRIDRLVRKKAEAALRLVAAAETATKPAKATRLLKRARMTLESLQRRIGKSAKISRKCRAMLVGQLTERRQLLADLTPGSR